MTVLAVLENYEVNWRHLWPVAITVGWRQWLDFWKLSPSSRLLGEPAHASPQRYIEVQRYRDTEVQRHRGTEAQRYIASI